MIEINLIPDVKQELIKAKRVRNMVISGAVVVGVVSVGIVILLAVYLFGVQTLRSSITDGDITKKAEQLKNVPDIENMLTIQSQLANVTELHNTKNIDSRLFDLLTAINPSEPNQVRFSLVKIDGETKTIHIEGQAANGFQAADVLKKTIEATKITYTSENDVQTKKLTESVSISNLSYGEDSNGAKVLRFSIDFVYSDALLARDSTKLTIVRPERQNATDSFKYLPESLFGARASDLGENE